MYLLKAISIENIYSELSRSLTFIYTEVYKSTVQAAGHDLSDCHTTLIALWRHVCVWRHSTLHDLSDCHTALIALWRYGLCMTSQHVEHTLTWRVMLSAHETLCDPKWRHLRGQEGRPIPTFSQGLLFAILPIRCLVGNILDPPPLSQKMTPMTTRVYRRHY